MSRPSSRVAPSLQPRGSVASLLQEQTHTAAKPSSAAARVYVRPTVAPSSVYSFGATTSFSEATSADTYDEEFLHESEEEEISGDDGDGWYPDISASPYGMNTSSSDAAMYADPYHAGEYSAAVHGDAYGSYYGATQDDDLDDEAEESEDESMVEDSDMDENVDVDIPPWRVPRSGTHRVSSAYMERRYGQQPWSKNAYAPSSAYMQEAEETPEARRTRVQEQKGRLPIQDQSSKVLPLLCGESPVCCLHGETGCGKSTQVPQMILEDATNRGLPCRIAVTQPRRVAAINLAKRVAEELGEDEPGGMVGFRIGGENKPGEFIDFCTVGYLMQLFTNAPEEFGKYTHIVLDEVHERTAESDMLCLVVRLLVSSRFHDTRVTVMSGTLQGDLFAEYFGSLAASSGGPTRVSVSARCFPVKEYFLEDIDSAFGSRLHSGKTINKLQLQMFPSDDDQKKKKEKIKPNHVEKLQVVVVDLVRCVAERGTTILVFLPGIAEISSVWEEARSLEESEAFKVFPLHSMIPREEQELVFQDPEPSVTNVVLATDIAESSVTLPNVVAVLDFGLHRRIHHDETGGVAALATKWISRAAATQRSGRAGRTRPGLCLRLYTRNLFENVMEAFEPPESASMPLDKLYLSAKQLCERLTSALGNRAPHSAETVLLQLVQPPDLRAIAKAREFNAELGVITAADERATITSLGRVCLQLPIELRVARLVWLGCHWGVAADAVVLAAVLSSLDVFTSPSPLFMRKESFFIDRLRESASSRRLCDGGHLSEPLMLRQLFLEWMMDFHDSEDVSGSKDYVFRARRRHIGDFAWRFSLSKGRTEHMISQILDLALRTIRLCEPESQADIQLRGLIAGLGYEVDERGDLSGIQSRFSELEGFFEEDAAYLKGLLAAAFSDQLMIGSYGNVPRDIDAIKSKLDSKEAVLKVIVENKLPPQRTVVLPGGMEDPKAYVDFVCGKISKSSISATAGGNKWSMVELEETGPQEETLRSTLASKATDSPRRLRNEWSLLLSFQGAMREMQKAKALSGWTYGPIEIQHPCRLHFEWMQHVFVDDQNSKKRKGPKVVRCEASFEKKNPVGFVAHVQDLQDGAGMRKVATLAVAAQVRGSEVPGRVFPSGVSILAPGHFAFVLATAPLKAASFGLKSIGFTTWGTLAILHRSITLPKNCVDSIRWDLISQLRNALRDALEVPELPTSVWSRGRAGTLLHDSPVESIVRKICHNVPCDQSGDEARLDEDYTSLAALAVGLVDPAAHGRQHGATAFGPLATWDELQRRREALMAKKTDASSNWQSHHQLPPAKRAKVKCRATWGDADIGREVVLHLASCFGPPGSRAVITGVGQMMYWLGDGMCVYFASQGITWHFSDDNTLNSASQASAAGSRAKHPATTASSDPNVKIIIHDSKIGRMSLQGLCHRVLSMCREIRTEQERQLLVSSFEAIPGKTKGVKKALKWAKEQTHFPKTADVSRVWPMLEELKRRLEQLPFAPAASAPAASAPAASAPAANAPAASAPAANVSAKQMPKKRKATEAGANLEAETFYKLRVRPNDPVNHSREELLKFTAKGLKGLLKLRGLSATGCVEKIDLVDKLLAHQGSTK